VRDGRLKYHATATKGHRTKGHIEYNQENYLAYYVRLAFRVTKQKYKANYVNLQSMTYCWMVEDDSSSFFSIDYSDNHTCCRWAHLDFVNNAAAFVGCTPAWKIPRTGNCNQETGPSLFTTLTVKAHNHDEHSRLSSFPFINFSAAFAIYFGILSFYSLTSGNGFSLPF
jgi:hypothetical protein